MIVENNIKSKSKGYITKRIAPEVIYYCPERLVSHKITIPTFHHTPKIICVITHRFKHA